MAVVLSPCVNVCTIEPASGLCVGCRRTLTEIGQWASLSEGDRARIMAELPARSLRSTSATASTLRR